MYSAELIDDNTSSPTTVAELLEKIQASRSVLEASVEQLSEVQLTTPEVGDGWSIKDQLAHIAIWESGVDGLLQGRSRFETMGLDEATVAANDVDELNDILIERSRQQSLAEVMTLFKDSHRRLLATILNLADDDLLKTYGHYQPDQPGEFSNRPIINWIANSTYEHYAEHYPIIEKVISQTTNTSNLPHNQAIDTSKFDFKQRLAWQIGEWLIAIGYRLKAERQTSSF